MGVGGGRGRGEERFFSGPTNAALLVGLGAREGALLVAVHGAGTVSRLFKAAAQALADNAAVDKRPRPVLLLNLFGAALAEDLGGGKGGGGWGEV